MKKKKLNYIKLILANLFITSLFVLILFLVPNDWRINFTVMFCYISFSTLFNLFITER